MLKLKIGDVCTLMLQSVDGSVNIDDYAIAGIFKYTSQHNKTHIFMNYDAAKTVYNTHLPSQIIINLHHLKDAKAMKSKLLEFLGCSATDSNKEVECKGMKISSYLDHMSAAKSIAGINKYATLMIGFFLVAISFIGIWSMQTENINERKKEIGSLLSFGFNKGAVKKIFLLESLYISILFFSIGSLITYIGIYLINQQNGLYLGESASFAFGSAIVNPILTTRDGLTVCLIALLYPFLATILSLKSIDKSNVIELLNGK